MLITASNKSNAKRSLKKFGDAAFAQAELLIIEQSDGRFGFEEDAAIAIRDGAAASSEITTVQEQTIAAETPTEISVVDVKPVRNPFGALFGTTTDLGRSQTSVIVRDGKKTTRVADCLNKPKQDLYKNNSLIERREFVKSGVCPNCQSANQHWVNVEVSKVCEDCGYTYSVKTAQPVKIGYKRPEAPSGYKIEPDRETRNGVTRRSKGSVGDILYQLFDAVGSTLTLTKAKELGLTKGIKTSSSSMVFYEWRKFNGYNKNV